MAVTTSGQTADSTKTDVGTLWVRAQVRAVPSEVHVKTSPLAAM